MITTDPLAECVRFDPGEFVVFLYGFNFQVTKSGNRLIFVIFHIFINITVLNFNLKFRLILFASISHHTEFTELRPNFVRSKQKLSKKTPSFLICQKKLLRNWKIIFRCSYERHPNWTRIIDNAVPRIWLNLEMVHLAHFDVYASWYMIQKEMLFLAKWYVLHQWIESVILRTNLFCINRFKVN